jgi:ketosteroid isomerase-like protein
MRMITAVAVFLAAPVTAVAQDESAEAEILEAIHAFHAALEEGDSAAAIARMHPDVTIYESGHAETLAEYRAGHMPGDMAFAAATDRVVREGSVAVLGDAALYTSQARTTGAWRDREIDSRGTETMLLVRTSEGWRIRHVHWSSRRSG